MSSEEQKDTDTERVLREMLRDRDQVIVRLYSRITALESRLEESGLPSMKAASSCGCEDCQ